MRWGYILGPLTLAPVLALCFLLPRPGQTERLHFDSAALSLLVCHTPGVALVSLPGAEAGEPIGAADTR